MPTTPISGLGLELRGASTFLLTIDKVVKKTLGIGTATTKASSDVDIATQKLQARYDAVNYRLKAVVDQQAALRQSYGQTQQFLDQFRTSSLAQYEKTVQRLTELERIRAAKLVEANNAAALARHAKVINAIPEEAEKQQKAAVRARQVAAAAAKAAADIRTQNAALLQQGTQYTSLLPKVDQYLQKLGYLETRQKSLAIRSKEVGAQLTKVESAQAKTGFFASMKAGLKETFSSWQNFTGGVKSASITIERLTRSATRTMKLLNRISGGKLFPDINKTKANLDKFNTSMQAAPGLMDRFHMAAQRAGSGVSFFGNFLGNLAATTVTNVIGSFVNLGRGAIGAVASFERLSLSMNSMVANEVKATNASLSFDDAQKQSIGRTQELLKWMQKLAIQSPFSVEDIQSAFQLSLAYGFTTKEAQQLAQATTDWASATGKGGDAIQTVSLAIGQMRLLGKVSGEDIRQLSNVGFPVEDAFNRMASSMKVTTAKLSDLRTKGLVPADVAIRALVATMEEKYGGAAAKMGSSFSGLLSSFGDVSATLSRNFFGPMNEQTGKVEGILGAFQKRLGGMLDVLMNEALQEGVKNMGVTLGETANDALDWGQNIILQLATGMLNGAVAVVNALAEIGNVIASWLMPGSPPMLLPDLDTWGTEAANTYMEGWKQLNAQSIFTDIGRELEESIRQQGDDKDQVGTLGRVLGLNSLVQSAQDEYARLGELTQSTFNQIVSYAGAGGGAMSQYVSALLKADVASRKVAAAQAELTKITKQYDDQISAVQDELNAISEARTAKDEDRQIARLSRIANDPRGSAARRAKAAEDLRELQLRRRLRDLEKEKKAAIDPLTARLQLLQREEELTKQQVELAKLQIDQLSQTNKLLDEQKKAAEAAAKAAAAGGGAGGPKKGGGGGPILPGLDTSKAGDLKGALAKLQEGLGGLLAPITRLQGAWERLHGAFIHLRSAVVLGYYKHIKPALDKFGSWFAKNKTQITTFLTVFATTLIVLAVAFGVASAAATILGTVLGTILSPIILIAGAVALFYTAWVNNWGGIRDILTNIWTNSLQPALAELWDWLNTYVPQALSKLTDFWNTTLAPALKDLWEWAKVNLFPVLGELVAWFVENIPKAIGELVSLWSDKFLGTLEKFFSFLRGDEGFGVLSTLRDWFKDFLPKAISFLTDLWNNSLHPALEKVWDFLSTYVIPLWESLANLLKEVVAASVRTLAEAFSDRLQQAIAAVHKFVDEKLKPIWEKLLPVFEKIGTYLSETFGPALDKLRDGPFKDFQTFWDNVKTSISGVFDWVLKIIDKINLLADAFKNVSLPKALTPGSPTPFEVGLRGISSALRELSQVSLPQLQAAMIAPPMRASQAGYYNNSSSVTNQYNYAPTYSVAPRNPSQDFAVMRVIAG